MTDDTKREETKYPYTVITRDKDGLYWINTYFALRNFETRVAWTAKGAERKARRELRKAVASFEYEKYRKELRP